MTKKYGTILRTERLDWQGRVHSIHEVTARACINNRATATQQFWVFVSMFGTIMGRLPDDTQTSDIGTPALAIWNSTPDRPGDRFTVLVGEAEV